MDICIDSRKIKRGQTYIPVKGSNFDGHDFIPEVLQKGAHVLDVDLTDYAKKYRKKLTCHVIGITGSAGKTTVKDMLYYTLSEKYQVSRTAENENNEIGVPITILKADSNTEILLVEMAMRARGEIKALAQIARPTHAVITNIGLTHVEILKTQRNIAYAKSEIFQKKLTWETEQRHAFLPQNSDYYPLLKKKAVTAGYTPHPYPGATSIDANINLCYQLGRHFNLTDEQIAKGLSNYTPSAHRLHVRVHKQHTVIDDTYNANPDAVRHALKFMQKFKGRKILVLGDMLELGAKSKSAHQQIIEDALDAEVSVMFTLGPECAAIKDIDGVSLSKFKRKDLLHKALSSELKSGDVILVKGSRGMKMEETVQFLLGESV